MTTEERELLASMIRHIMEKSKKRVTDTDVENALNRLEELAANADGADSYTYEHPDYKALVGQVTPVLQLLMNNGDDCPAPSEVERLMDACAQIGHDELAESVSSLIYYWIDKWHYANTDEAEGDDASVWLHPLHVAIMLAERHGLRECLPALLEIERQDRDFAETFFDQCDMVGMVPACIYQTATEQDLPLLAEFMRERGLRTFHKAEVAAAVATLPRRLPELMQPVQQWMMQLLATFEKEIDPAVGDVMLLEAIIHCCVHLRMEAAKAMIIRLYSKYKMPNVLLPGGVNDVRKNIKRADIGVLREDMESAEDIYFAADNYEEEDYEDEDFDDYEDEDFDDYEEYDGDEEEDFDDDHDADDDDDDDDDDGEDEDLAPRQEYCGWAAGAKAVYMPVKSLKKFTLRIELKGSKPLVWRELQVASNLSLTSLAKAILLAMGWDEDHMHQFIAGRNEHYATHEHELSMPLFPGNKAGNKYSVGHLLHRQGDSIMFEYDYGDSWYHTITLSAIDSYADGEKPRVALTGGANACPPDDCGGTPRYNYLVQLMKKKPDCAELADFYDWMGCKWDPKFFPQQQAAAAVDRMNG